MKATHKIKLKSIEDILKQEDPHKLLAVDYLVFINENQGNYIDVKLRDDGCFLTEDTCIGHSHVSHLNKIKPKKEMRPWGYNDFNKVWSNGITVYYDDVMYLITQLSLNGVKINGEFMNFHKVHDKFTDRHGNKFEKEV